MITPVKRTLLLFALLLSLGGGSVSASNIVTNSKNSETVDGELLMLVLTGKEKFWKSGSEVIIAVLRSDAEADAALTRYSGMTPSKFKNHWQRIAFSGRGKMPKMFSSLEELVAFVENNEGAIGIISSKGAANGLRRIDFTEKLAISPVE